MLFSLLLMSVLATASLALLLCATEWCFEGELVRFETVEVEGEEAEAAVVAEILNVLWRVCLALLVWPSCSTSSSSLVIRSSGGETGASTMMMAPSSALQTLSKQKASLTAGLSASDCACGCASIACWLMNATGGWDTSTSAAPWKWWCKR